MAFIHLAIFLMVAAVVIAVVKPLSKKQIWLYSLLTPAVLMLIHIVIRALFNESVFTNAAVMGQATGSSLIPVVISFIVLYICLESKYNKKENYKFPKWLIVLIVIFLAVGSYSQYLNYQVREGIQDYIDTRSLNDENEDEIEKDTAEPNEIRKEITRLVEDCNNNLPEDLGDGMSMTKCELVNQSLIYTFQLKGMSPSDFPEEVVSDIKKNNFREIIEDLKNDPSMKDLIINLKKESYNVVLKYVNEKDELLFDMNASPSEL